MVTYEYTAVTQQITKYNYVDRIIEYPSSIDVDGATYAQGDTFHGSFSYDTATPLTFYYSDFQDRYTAYHGEAVHHVSTLIFDNHNPTYHSAPDGAGAQMSVTDAHSAADDIYRYPDYLQLVSFNGNYFLGFDFANSTDNSIIDGPHSPASLSLERFPYAWATFGRIYEPALGFSMEAAGRITSLTLVPAMPVPEPSSYAMLLAGAVLVAWARRSRLRG